MTPEQWAEVEFDEFGKVIGKYKDMFDEIVAEEKSLQYQNYDFEDEEDDDYRRKKLGPPVRYVFKIGEITKFKRPVHLPNMNNIPSKT